MTPLETTSNSGRPLSQSNALPRENRAPNAAQPDNMLVYISGSGHCGSTLLSILLNNHSQIRSVGEVHRLTIYARENLEPCSCGQPVLECPFWQSVEEAASRRMPAHAPRPVMIHRDPCFHPHKLGRAANWAQKALLIAGRRQLYSAVAKVGFSPHEEAARNSFFWYDAIREASGCPIVVDATKDARRLKILYLTRTTPMKVIYLVRDGRAVAASMMRRTGLNMQASARAWVKNNRHAIWAQRSLPKQDLLQLRYEDLCQHTDQEMQRVCQFLGVAYEPAMLTLDKSKCCDIGGNPMRFRQDEQSIKLDEKWKQQLTPADLQVFETIAGKLNRSFGNA